MKNTTNRSSHVNYFAEVTLALIRIRDTRGSGRLSIRNNERVGLAHLYFKDARLIHVTGNKKDGEAVLQELLNWTRGFVRFDSESTVDYEDITWQQAEIFARWLALLEMHGAIHGVARTKLEGLGQQLMEKLPRKPISLPLMVENYEERDRSVQLNESLQQLVERALPSEQREQLSRLSQVTAQYVDELVQQAGRVTKEITKHARLLRSHRANSVESRPAKPVEESTS
ncbi:DUF4388 domain-containing protein [Ktedonosporobacter rubrisoli]|uniref:DUF4388 domain-containing protein n=1 Tax=Ktedonosporobacter rubrisoli TaxID=2509675 RepID=A0A4P6JS71_KTERU|nr:DUF4388 domain-containing protein [Ktedonosporobacter rubrisoli]QBD78378.1 DUF4388 domain-containing protein [Ktedonosporobacter rubrisoli]